MVILKWYVFFSEYRLFARPLLQKRPITLRSLLIVATPYLCLVSYPSHSNVWMSHELHMNVYIHMSGIISESFICPSHSYVWMSHELRMNVYIHMCGIISESFICLNESRTHMTNSLTYSLTCHRNESRTHRELVMWVRDSFVTHSLTWPTRWLVIVMMCHSY